MGVAGSRDAGTSGAGAVPVRSAQMMGQQNNKQTKQNETKPPKQQKSKTARQLLFDGKLEGKEVAGSDGERDKDRLLADQVSAAAHRAVEVPAEKHGARTTTIITANCDIMLH